MVVDLIRRAIFHQRGKCDKAELAIVATAGASIASAPRDTTSPTADGRACLCEC
jgi:hypothetical protein